jgi:DHA2 family multidrug resistance protein
MAIFGIGIMVGPIMGPTLGGYLTDAFNWRWAFYVKPAVRGDRDDGSSFPHAGDAARERNAVRLDRLLGAGDGARVPATDAGPRANAGLVQFARNHHRRRGGGARLLPVPRAHVHGEEPFLPLGLFKDRNFTTACEMVSMLIAGRIAGKYMDPRKLMAFGLVGLVLTMHSMTTWHPDKPQGEITATLIFQGFAMGFVYNPMTVMAFATLPASLRNHGAARENLAWCMGAAIGVSVTAFMMVRSQQASHAELAGVITPFNRLLQHHDAVTRMLDPSTTHGAELLNEMINRQARIIAFNNDIAF